MLGYPYEFTLLLSCCFRSLYSFFPFLFFLMLMLWKICQLTTWQLEVIINCVACSSGWDGGETQMQSDTGTWFSIGRISQVVCPGLGGRCDCCYASNSCSGMSRQLSTLTLLEIVIHYHRWRISSSRHPLLPKPPHPQKLKKKRRLNHLIYGANSSLNSMEKYPCIPSLIFFYFKIFQY